MSVDNIYQCTDDNIPDGFQSTAQQLQQRHWSAYPHAKHKYGMVGNGLCNTVLLLTQTQWGQLALQQAAIKTLLLSKWLLLLLLEQYNQTSLLHDYKPSCRAHPCHEKTVASTTYIFYPRTRPINRDKKLHTMLCEHSVAGSAL